MAKQKGAAERSTTAAPAPHNSNLRDFVGSRLAYEIDEFTRVTSLSRASLYNMIASGVLRSTKVGGRNLILADDALRFLEGQRDGTLRYKNPGAEAKKKARQAAAKRPEQITAA
jgi:hypothetical protein